MTTKALKRTTDEHHDKINNGVEFIQEKELQELSNLFM